MGPSPAPGSWMHRLRRSMPSWRIAILTHSLEEWLGVCTSFLPRRFLALGGAEVAGFAPCARFCSFGAADVALASRSLQHVLHLDQLGLVVLHVLDECASGVVGAKDLLVDKLLGEVLSEEGGVGDGGDVGGGEPEDLYDLFAHEGMLLLNRCIQEPGAGDGPTSVVLDFLRLTPM